MERLTKGHPGIFRLLIYVSPVECIINCRHCIWQKDKRSECSVLSTPIPCWNLHKQLIWFPLHSYNIDLQGSRPEIECLIILPRLWGNYIRLAVSPSKLLGATQVCNDGIISMFVKVGGLRTLAWFEVIRNLEAHFLLGISSNEYCIRDIFLSKCKGSCGPHGG